MGVGSRVRGRTCGGGGGHRAGRFSVVFFWSERVLIQPRLRRKIFFWAKINNIFSQGGIGKKGFLHLIL